MKCTIGIGAMGLMLAAAAASQVQAASEPVYRVQDEVVMRGTVTKVATIPDWMGKDSVNISLQSPDAVAAHVDLATAGFLRLLDVNIAVGDDVQLKGCWSQAADGTAVFLVHEIKKQRVTLNVRDPRGIPLW